MVKISTPISDDGGGKRYGVMPAIVDEATTAESISQAGNKYSTITVSLTANNDTKNGLTRKMFFKFPYDNWTKPGEDLSLLKQFRMATGMSADECNDTDNYKGKGCYVVLAPTKGYKDDQWKTFETKEGKTRLSYNVTAILSKEEAKNAEIMKKIDVETAKLVERATAEALGTTPVASAKPLDPQNDASLGF